MSWKLSIRLIPENEGTARQRTTAEICWCILDGAEVGADVIIFVVIDFHLVLKRLLMC